MFNFGKKENKKTESSSPVLPTNEYNTPVHTMQDDLNALEGLQPSPGTSYQASSRPQQSATSQGQLPSSTQQGKSNSYSPFLNGPASQNSPGNAPQNYNPLQDYAPQQAPLEPADGKFGTDSQNNASKLGKVLIIGTSLMAFLALAAGGYYFWITRKSSPEIAPPVDNESQVELEEEPEIPIVIEPPKEKYSLFMPNYLMADTDSASSETIKNIILNAADEVRELNSSQPVEFIIVDNNNNPISFSVFAVTTGLNFSPVIENLSESFSLFIYNDEGNTRLGLSMNVKDKPKTVITMAEKEKTATEDFSFIFLNSIPQKPADATFKSSVKPNYTNRYLNYDIQNTGSLSFDYTFIGERLIIATSRNTMNHLANKFLSSF